MWRGGGCRNAVVGVAASCSDSVRPLSCILARRACSVGFASLRNFGRSFYKASVPYPQNAGSPSSAKKAGLCLFVIVEVWRGGVVEMCLLCWFRIVRNLGQALSRILAFAVVWVGASLRRLCATAIVHPLHVYERSVGFASLQSPWAFIL